METNTYATRSETVTWFRAERRSGPNYGWIMLFDADTRDAAEDRLFESYGATVNDPGYRVRRIRGL